MVRSAAELFDDWGPIHIEKHLGNNGRESGLLREAVDIQITLPYSEPPLWRYLVRQSLGTSLLRRSTAEAAGRNLKSI